MQGVTNCGVWLMSQDARDALQRFKDIVMKGTNNQVFHFATAAGIVTGKEKAAQRPSQEELGQQLAAVIFPGYDWENPHSKKKRWEGDTTEEDDDEQDEAPLQDEEDDEEEDAPLHPRRVSPRRAR